MTNTPPPEAQFKTPGQLIQHLLDQKGWTQVVLSIVLGTDRTTLSKVIAGQRPIDAEMALGLGEVFGVRAEQFMELQKSWDLAQARLKSMPDPGRTNRAHLFGDLPVAEMIKRGWLDADNVRDVANVETALAKFFGAKSAAEIEFLPHAAKKTDVAGNATPAQLAWLYRVNQIATEMLVAKYSPNSMQRVIDELRPLRASAEGARKVPRILAENGIRFVIVEALTGSKIDGVCFWLNETSPVIGMSLRYDRIDNFWFVLRHEIEHVIQRHGLVSKMLDAELEGDRAGVGPNVPEEERIANQAAADFCVPRRSLESFIERKSPFFAERDIIGFSRTMQIHPGLVAGQLQRNIGRYDRFRNHLVKIRSIVSPGSMVDGWGDVAPVGI